MGDSKCGILVPANLFTYGLASRHEANPILPRHASPQVPSTPACTPRTVAVPHL